MVGLKVMAKSDAMELSLVSTSSKLVCPSGEQARDELVENSESVLLGRLSMSFASSSSSSSPLSDFKTRKISFAVIVQSVCSGLASPFCRFRRGWYL